MSKFVIHGGKQLEGEIKVNGSKNAVLPLIAASLLTNKKVIISNVPNLVDVVNQLDIAKSIGAKCDFKKDRVVIEADNIVLGHMDARLTGRLRGSVLFMGALLGRCKLVSMPQPGGDIIGARPIDVHLDAFEQLGAKVTRDGNLITVDGSKMKAGHVVLREFSVTATENVMMIAATLPGKTIIEIAAGEPHIVALADLLNMMGAKISGAGTHTLEIEGKQKLHGANVDVIPDMLEAGFFILLAAATKSIVDVERVPVKDLMLFFKKLDDIGVDYEIYDNMVEVRPAELKAFKVQTLPQPGIATDLQAPFSVVATQAIGSSLIHDPMYESRFKHCDELIKMGANVTVCDPHRVIVEGPAKLFGRYINSLDIRSGATLIMAGLVAEGETIIDEAEIIDRGYADIVERLKGLGADIDRVDNQG